MTFEVFDFRNDLKNVFMSPEIRSRFVKMEPGEISVRHSHDLGHEIFLILQGKAEFEIEDHKKVLEAGQLCVARIDEKHSITCLGDEPMIMYLSVTPHVEPTHTRWDEHGQKLPPNYDPSTREDRSKHDPATGKSAMELAEALNSSVRDLAVGIDETAKALSESAPEAIRAVRGRNRESAKQSLDEMWAHVFGILRDVSKTELAWNQFSARIDELTCPHGSYHFLGDLK